MGILFVMRIENMSRSHPDTDYSHKCIRCDALVGIYPSGQRLLRADPAMRIICDVCALGMPDEIKRADLAPGAAAETRESIPLVPDIGPRHGRYHKAIVSAEPIAGTRTGKKLTLECGHTVVSFGNLLAAEGRVLCQECRRK